MAGDPKQLGPVILSQQALKMGYGTGLISYYLHSFFKCVCVYTGISLLERLLNYSAYTINPEMGQLNADRITKLVNNFRSHPAIIAPSNEMFYDGELKAVGDKGKYKIYMFN